jgi:hypothetical protein
MFRERWSHAGENRGEKKDEAIISADQPIKHSLVELLLVVSL